MDKPIIIFFIGGAGCRIAARLRALPESSQLKLLAIDTDRQALQESGLPAENTILAAESWRRGQGCGGDVQAGQNSIANARSAIGAKLGEAALVIIVGGLGGGVATGGIPVVLSVAAQHHLPTLCLVTMPFFSLESTRRTVVAEKALQENIFPAADAVITLPNDLLFSTLAPQTPMRQAFELADEEVARTALALSGILGGGNLFSSDFNDFCTLLKAQKNLCAIGVGVAPMDAENPIDLAVSNLLHSPLLGGAAQLDEADAAIFTVLGGPELSLGDAKTALETGRKFLSRDCQILTGAATSPAWRGKLQLSVLTLKFDSRDDARVLLDHPAATAESLLAPVGNSAEPGKQLTFDLDNADKGCMEGTIQVNYNGEDLDIPTFKRRNLSISPGKVVRK